MLAKTGPRGKPGTTEQHKAVTLQLDEVPEGGRTDIYHFESTSRVPAVTDDIKAKWPK